MEGACSSALQVSNCGGKCKGFVNQGLRKQCSVQLINSSGFQLKRGFSIQNRRGSILALSQSSPILESGNFYPYFDESWLLKTKAQEVSSILNGRCIFLVGMMGSGKTTVGNILSEALGYSFIDSDAYVEETAGGTPVTQIFSQRGESFFRDCESEALRELSLMPQQLVATGGGVVIRPINWKYMKQGITVFLDVPLDALARRIAAVGTDSRPLLHLESGDPYTKAFMGLFTLSKKRSEAYASADVAVSHIHLAAKLGVEDVADISPTAIATEVLVQVDNFLRGH